MDERPDLPTLDYAPDPRRRRPLMAYSRIGVALFGVMLPYLARVPGAYFRPDWLTSYLEPSPFGHFFIGAFNAINWGTIVAGTMAYRTAGAILVSAVVGFAYPAYAHATLDLASDAQAGIGLVAIPIVSLPFVGLGWLLGLAADRVIVGRSTASGLDESGD